jgi:5-carboxymethyl-2-hydroxymuconate isomerase
MHTVIIPATGQTFSVGKILCIGRNYAEHARELGNEVPAAPVIFMKPATAILADGSVFTIPAYSNNCHHEAELAVLIGSGGRMIPEAQALEHVAGYGVAIDFTLRDVQDELKKKGLPWEIAKGFDGSCPLSSFAPAAAVADPSDLEVMLEINGEMRQQGSTSLMIHSVAAIISHMSGIFTLEPGDVILTGTPAGVGPVRPGDVLTARVTGIASLTINVGG